MAPNQPDTLVPLPPMDNEDLKTIKSNVLEADAPAVEAIPIPSKGTGVVALRDIQPGEILMSERPLIYMPDEIYQIDEPVDIEIWLDKRINKMTEPDRVKFYSLTDSRGDTDSDRSAFGIFFTNCMNYEGDAALFPEIARVNHSCKPNADFVANTAGGPEDPRMDLVSTDFIAKGQEVLLCYMPSADEATDVRKVRRDYLETWYGFKCTCAVCLLKEKALTADNSLRKRIKCLQKKLGEEGDSAGSSISLKEFVELFYLLENAGKLPYRIEIGERLLERSIKEGRFDVFARVLVTLVGLDEVIDPRGLGGRRYEAAARNRGQIVSFASAHSVTENVLFFP